MNSRQYFNASCCHKNTERYTCIYHNIPTKFNAFYSIASMKHLTSQLAVYAHITYSKLVQVDIIGFHDLFCLGSEIIAY